MNATADAFFGIFGMTRVEQPMKLDVVVPIEVKNPVNGSHGKATAYKALLVKELKAKVAEKLYEADRIASPDVALFEEALRSECHKGARVTLLRPYTSQPLDNDNLGVAFKNVRDSVASFLGEDDGSPRYHWRYTQVKARQVGQKLSKVKRRKKGEPKPELPPKRRNVAAYDTHIRIRIEIVPAAEVDPLLTALRALRVALTGLKDEAEKEPHHNWSLLERRCMDAEDALATADALATFDPKELYNV